MGRVALPDVGDGARSCLIRLRDLLVSGRVAEIMACFPEIAEI